MGFYHCWRHSLILCYVHRILLAMKVGASGWAASLVRKSIELLSAVLRGVEMRQVQICMDLVLVELIRGISHLMIWERHKSVCWIWMVEVHRIVVD